MSLEKNKELPVGLGKREVPPGLEVAMNQVENKVIWVNPHINSPFDIKEGTRTNLGLFATENKEGPEGVHHAEGSVLHGRTVIIGRVIFSDDSGRLYRDVDLKGIGNLVGYDNETKIGVSPLEKTKTIQGTLGIFERSIAEEESSWAEKLLEIGVRTYRIIAITKLKEIIYKGKKQSIAFAKARGILPIKSEPAVSIRAFGTRDRINDLLFSSNVGNKTRDARKLVSQEFGFSEEGFENTEYLEWFVQALAENIARMHRAGLVHEYLTKHNITLDCRIVDLDSVRPIEVPASSKDMEYMLGDEFISSSPGQGYRDKNFYRNPNDMEFSSEKEEELHPYRKDVLDASQSLATLSAILREDDVEIGKKFINKYLESMRSTS